MPTIACPDCNRYVQVPNVSGNAFFDCPTCPRLTARKLLYKCSACMKVSMLAPGARICPKCSTMVRPNVRQLLAPTVHLPSQPSDWIYHTTNVEIANSIKLAGLIPTFLRTGNDIAHPQGAFARNRDKRLASQMNTVLSTHPLFQKVKEGLAYLICLGAPLATIELLVAVPVAIVFVPNGGDGDGPNLRTSSDAALQALAIQLGYGAAPLVINTVPKYSDTRKLPGVIAKALQIANMPGHCLTIWAMQYVTLYYRIEEMKTARNVYFTKHNFAVPCYNEYTAGVSKAIIVVLRVRKAQIVGLIDDISEFKAECTPNIVLPGIIEIFVALNPDKFVIEIQRDSPANWIAIQHWGA
ncbi:hypothetical protein [Rugamonas rivuli]|uniref:Uncharacterized protein n=1 Tax=Rugamonas rivuli TaxID=2743358 RepID=A0A843S976_9BURK|nr:hypothetical protein [Rugamonas rivuli]MQA18781.1 hypothetical protein [Rugamonas rivuli]